ncbi:conserved hypothetical protein [Streptomyces viridochromogenes DSM 40736]|uniref:PucR C-terminal helix-turn-helix domain-containing protein n=1 Tax=Streptomyces viridochromogenes (strain DSM 40736 / JCM 4977 / BCRC 1201 / Tue 494) TaxID=591159 RepID=D9XA98_STRVT|nr:conserved hypothetical protein [Streptomyces viridochromogenes DSM 40736]
MRVVLEADLTHRARQPAPVAPRGAGRPPRLRHRCGRSRSSPRPFRALPNRCPWATADAAARRGHVVRMETAAATTPWLSKTLHAVASTGSLRAAAAAINIHHSTLQDRLAHAEHLLGWPVRTPQGRLRLQLALAMRHLARP